MRKFILIITLFIGLSVTAQTETLTIYNYTDCAINFTLFAHVDGEDCQNDQYQSMGFLLIYPNSSISFDNFNLYGSSTFNWFGGGGLTGTMTGDQLNQMGDARFVAFKTNDGTGISIGLQDCGATTDIEISACGNTSITASFNEVAPLTKVVTITD